MAVVVDRLIYMIDNVSPVEFQKLKDDLDTYEIAGKIAKVTQQIGMQASNYHYQLHIGTGEGAIFVGWQHNMSRGDVVRGEVVWTMKVEYNPAKAESHELVLRLLQKRFAERSKRITSIDFALDIPIKPDDIFVIPKQGREENRYRGDRYYGVKSHHGYLKVYDKKRERREKAKIDIPEEQLTRIEYTWKIKEGIGLPELRSFKNNLVLADEYIIRNINGLMLDKIKPEIRACLIAVMWGQMQVKEFSRRMRPHIEKALGDCEEVALGSQIQDSWENIIELLTKHIENFDDSVVDAIAIIA